MTDPSAITEAEALSPVVWWMMGIIAFFMACLVSAIGALVSILLGLILNSLRKNHSEIHHLRKDLHTYTVGAASRMATSEAQIDHMKGRMNNHAHRLEALEKKGS